MTSTPRKFSRRVTIMFWLLLVSIIIGLLIYFEQIAILYVLATISLIALLLTVSFSDLENVGRTDSDSSV